MMHRVTDENETRASEDLKERKAGKKIPVD
jgi:hypothetical protein